MSGYKPTGSGPNATFLTSSAACRQMWNDGRFEKLHQTYLKTFMLFSQQFRLQESVLRKHVENTSHTDLRRGVIYEMQEPKRPDPSDVEKDEERGCARACRAVCAPQGTRTETFQRLEKTFIAFLRYFFLTSSYVKPRIVLLYFKPSGFS